MSDVHAPRVVATDLDGTLLHSDGTLSSRTRAALQALAAAGIDVVFVTARPPRWLPDLTDAVSGHGHIICLGGSCQIDAATGETLDSRGFADEAVAELAADLRAAIPGIMFGAERADGAAYERSFGYDTSWAAYDLVPVDISTRIEDSLGGPWPVAKFMARVSIPTTPMRLGVDPDADGFLAAAEQVVGSRGHFAYSGSPGLAEFLAPGVTKASGLERWCSARGYRAEDVWAFGDMPNDLPMLAWAGRSFAMGNAHPAVLAAATARTATNDEDGVARALEAMLG